MVNTKNYFAIVKSIDHARLPADLQERYDYVKEVTEDHTSWDFYRADGDIKATVDQYLADLSDYLEAKPAAKDKATAVPTETEAREVAKKLIQVYALRGDTVSMLSKSMLGSSGGWGSAHIAGGKIHVDMVGNRKLATSIKFPLHSIYNEVLAEGGEKPPAATPAKPPAKPRGKKIVVDPPRKTGKRVKIKNAQPVERIDEAVRFIKRYTLMHGKIKTDRQILTFINSLQKAILEKRVRKTSTFSPEIEHIQTNLIKLHNNMGREVEIKLKADVLERFLEIAGSEQVRLSVAYMKRYIGVQGKHIDKEKAKRLHALVSTAIEKEKISKSDPYRDKIFRVLSSLKSFIDKAKPADTLQLHSAVLNGINEALDGCCPACDEKKAKKRKQGLGAIPETVAAPPEGAIMSSMDFAGMQFETLGFMGKWKEFMGDPAAGFTAMVSARPKMGKSYLCADFAGYLARHHGQTLFVAGEEKLGHTLQQKIDAVKHPCLHVTAALPGDLSPYDFIVLDSVSRLRLTPEDLRILKAQYPGKSFIYVYQVTKAGKFRGSNEAQHDVDIVVEIPEKGRAVQFGRFNQGGEMDVFGVEYGQAV